MGRPTQGKILLIILTGIKNSKNISQCAQSISPQKHLKFTRSEENRDEVILVPAVLPLPGLGTLQFLSALTSNMGPNIFDNDAMGLVLRVMWESGIQYYFWLDFTLHVVFFICWVFLVDRTSISTSQFMDPTAWGTSLLPWLVLGLNSFFCFEQTVRYIGSGRQFFRS